MSLSRYTYLLFLLGSLCAWAAVSVQTQVSTNQVSLNEPFVYAITIVAENTQDPPETTEPEFPENLPFTILRKDPPRPSQNSQTTIINGKITSSSTYSITLVYQLKPKFEGKHQIPALEIKAGGKTLQTDPITITVTANANADGASAQFTAAFSEPQAMLGYPVTLNYDILLPEQRGIRNLSAHMPREFLDANFTLVEGQGSWDEVGWDERRRIINGIPCVNYHLELQLLPKQAGTLTLPAAVLSYEVPDRAARTRRRDPFGGFFDDDPFMNFFGSYRTVSVASDEITLEVQPLPTEGQPADFSGIVGHPTISARLSATEVTVGEPIILDIELSGAPQLGTAKLPDLARLPDFAQHFRISGDDPALEQDGKTIFQRTLRATHSGEVILPAIAISYYDPAAREYRAASTQPIALTVAAARQITLNDAQGNLAPEAPRAATATTELRAAHTIGLEPDFPPERLTGTRLSPFMPPSRLLAPFLWLAIPPLCWGACALLVFISRKRHANTTQRAARGAKGALLRTVAKLRDDDPKGAVKFAAALQEFFAAKFQLPPGTVTFADAQKAALHHGYTDAQIEPFREIFQLCEASQYAGGAFDLTAAKSLLNSATKEF